MMALSPPMRTPACPVPTHPRVCNCSLAPFHAYPWEHDDDICTGALSATPLRILGMEFLKSRPQLAVAAASSRQRMLASRTPVEILAELSPVPS